MRIVIAGAGIAGLTAALAAHRQGIGSVLLDAADVSEALGVGINLLPHAVAELTALGLGAELARYGRPVTRHAHFDTHGNLIWAQARGTAAGAVAPQLSIHRGELHQILLRAVRERLGAAAIRTGAGVSGYTNTADGVTVILRDGKTLSGAALLGADGVHSAVRAQLHPGEGKPHWSGVHMWRGVSMAESFAAGHTVSIFGSNAAAKFVAYPISPGEGPVQVNWVAEVQTNSEAGLADWRRTGSRAEVAAHYSGWDCQWLDIPGLIAGAPEILEYPMVDRDPLPYWGRGRVTLIGDAAHPMYPVGSNGASQAIIDAAVLAAELARDADPATGFRAYEAIRREVVNATVRACREMPADRILQLVAQRAPHGFDDITNVLSAAELDAISKAYQQTSTAVPAGEAAARHAMDAAALHTQLRKSRSSEHGWARVPSTQRHAPDHVIARESDHAGRNH